MWKGFRFSFWKSLEFPLIASSLSSSECEQLNKALYKCILPALGVNRNIKRIFRYAPLQYGGLNLPEFMVEQEISHVLTIMEHYGESTSTSSFLATTIEYAQLQVGTITPFLTLPFKRYGFLLS